MKHYLLSAILLLAGIFSAQAEPVCYQAQLTDRNGDPSRNEAVTLQLTLLDADGATTYSESLAATTDACGRIAVMLGSGTPLQGEYSDEVWSAAAALGVEITRADGSKITDEAALSAAPAAQTALQASTLVSPEAADGSRYELAVDDAGKLSTVKVSNDYIEIPKGYSRLLFHDEFSGEGLPDPKYWSYEEGKVRNGEEQYYTVARPENCDIRDGLLNIILRNDNYEVGGKGYPYTSASIHTRYKVPFTYGRVEVRAKLPACKGTWPAIWLMPNKDVYGMWPRSGEIDIMEQVGFDPDIVHFTAHSYLNHGEGNKQHNSMRVPTNHTDFHVYALDWLPNKLTWYVDGKRGFTVVKTSSLWTGWPYDQDFYLILNLAWGGGWGGQHGLDPASLPQTYQVDYVRIFQ